MNLHKFIVTNNGYFIEIYLGSIVRKSCDGHTSIFGNCKQNDQTWWHQICWAYYTNFGCNGSCERVRGEEQTKQSSQPSQNVVRRCGRIWMGCASLTCSIHVCFNFLSFFFFLMILLIVVKCLLLLNFGATKFWLNTRESMLKKKVFCWI